MELQYQSTRSKHLLVIFLIFSITVSANSQRLFWSDSTYVSEKKVFFGGSRLFFNLGTGLLDSVDNYPCMIPRPVFDTCKIWVEAECDSNGRINGKVKSYFYRGRSKKSLFSITYSNSVPNGVYISNICGDSSYIVFYKNGKKDGLEVFYNIVSGLKFYETYENGVLHGPVYTTLEGQLVKYVNYDMGKKCGIEYELHDNGDFMGYLIYENGQVKDGKYYIYYPDGNKWGKLFYKNNKKIKEIIYGKSGEVIKKNKY